MRYARSDVEGYTPPGGACPGHTLAHRADKTSRLLSVDCAACEPFLAHDPLWAATVQEVPLTAAEQTDADAKQREAELQSAKMGDALARLVKEAMHTEQDAKAAPPAAKRRARPPKTPPQDAA